MKHIKNFLKKPKPPAPPPHPPHPPQHPPPQQPSSPPAPQYAPAPAPPPHPPRDPAPPGTLDIQLQNQTDSPDVYAYITGISLLPEHAGSRVLVKADGRSLYVPQSPSQLLQPLAEDVAIPLGPPGAAAVTARIPRMAGGRIWFSRGPARLTFLLNPGPALVEPSVLNPSDPNADVDFSFAEFTLNQDQLFANITYVDFVSRLPVALTLRDRAGAVQHVSGMAADGLARVGDGLRAQARRDGKPWDRLIVQRGGGADPPLRVLSPTHGDAVGASFQGHFEPLVDAAWDKYHPRRGGCRLQINTQAGPGVVSGAVAEHDGRLYLGGEPFERPTSADILGCNSGPFATGPNPTRNAIIPRLAAAFQRSSLLETEAHPSHPDTFYGREPVNHYCRLVHEANLDRRGYAFAYDDVQPDGGEDQSGKVNAPDPETFIVAVGGGRAYAGDKMEWE